MKGSITRVLDMASAEAVIRVCFDSEKVAEAVYKALLPDVGEMPTGRGGASIVLNGREVTVNVWARDLTALRALVNSYLRLLYAIHSVINVSMRVEGAGNVDPNSTITPGRH